MTTARIRRTKFVKTSPTANVSCAESAILPRVLPADKPKFETESLMRKPPFDLVSRHNLLQLLAAERHNLPRVLPARRLTSSRDIIARAGSALPRLLAVNRLSDPDYSGRDSLFKVMSVAK